MKTREKTKFRNAFNNNKSTDLKLSKVWISKIFQCAGFLELLSSKFEVPLMKVSVPLERIY